MGYSQSRIERFDQVKLRTTKNVEYLSAPSNTKVSPQGVWSVVASVAGELLLAKNNAIIKIPASDVLVISEYDLEDLNSVLGKLSNGKAEKSNADSEE